MGAIQNSLNSITGTAAVGAYAVGKISDIKNADVAAGEAAKKEVIGMAEDMPKLKEEIAAAEDKLKVASADKEALWDLKVETPEDVQALDELTAEVNQDEKMAKLAKATVEGKMRAKLKQLGRLQNTIERAQRWTGGRK